MTTTINNEHKKLNVPNLRFPEFQGEWEKYELGDICDIITDFVAAGSFASLRENVKYYQENNYAQLIRTIDLKNNFTNSDFVYVDEVAYDFLWRVQLKEPNIVLPNIGANIGEKYYVKPQDLPKNKNVLGPNAILLRSKCNDTHFVYFRLSTSSYDNEMKKLVGASGQPKFNKTDLKKVSLFMPSLIEQKRIAYFLALLEERIATQNKIIEDLKKLKSAIIEKHYCKVEKQIACVGDLGEPFSVGNLAKDDLTETGIPCVIYGELFTTYGETISQIESHTYKTEGIILSKKGDLLFPSSTTVDAMSLIAPSVINMDGVILGGDMFGIHISPNFNAQYLSYYFNHIAKRQLAKFAKGSTIIHLHYADIEKAKLLLPSLEEQNRVAKCLVTLDDKIKKERTFFDLLNSQKAYLLCHMFI